MNPAALYRKLKELPHAPCEMIFENEAIALAEAARGRVVVEIGAWYGCSTAMLASTAAFVISIDPHLGHLDTTREQLHERSLEKMHQTLIAADVAERVLIIPSTSVRAFPTVSRLVGGSGIGCLFIDGSHLEEDVFNDLNLYGTLLNHDAYLVMDDLGYGSVQKAFDRWRQPGVKPVDLHRWNIVDPIHNRLHEGAVSKMTFFKVGG